MGEIVAAIQAATANDANPEAATEAAVSILSRQLETEEIASLASQVQEENAWTPFSEVARGGDSWVSFVEEQGKGSELYFRMAIR